MHKFRQCEESILIFQPWQHHIRIIEIKRSECTLDLKGGLCEINPYFSDKVAQTKSKGQLQLIKSGIKSPFCNEDKLLKPGDPRFFLKCYLNYSVIYMHSMCFSEISNRKTIVTVNATWNVTLIIISWSCHLARFLHLDILSP